MKWYALKAYWFQQIMVPYSDSTTVNQMLHVYIHSCIHVMTWYLHAWVAKSHVLGEEGSVIPTNTFSFSEEICPPCLLYYSIHSLVLSQDYICDY